MKLSETLPIYDITNKGIIIGDIQGNLTICFRVHLPKVFSMGSEDFQNVIESFRVFTELLGDNILIHRQDFYHRKLFSLINEKREMDNANKIEAFLNTAYQTHFNERPYLSMESYMYITKINSSAKGFQNTLISKSYASTDETYFLENVLNATEVLRRNGIETELLNREYLLSSQSPISKYCNFSDAQIEQLRDISFENNKVYVGSTEVSIYTIESLEQFGVENVAYHRKKNNLPVSNMFSFSFPLAVPHVANQYLYIPEQREENRLLEEHRDLLKKWNYAGSNEEAYNETIVLGAKSKELACKLAYYHYNIMAFDDTRENIEKQIGIAFKDSGFKKKENTISRKDLFLSAIPSNGARLVTQRKNLMSLLLDLEGLAFFNWEQNYEQMSATGVRLCDRIYGIPFCVNIFEEPLKKGIINNKNCTIMAGTGGGKSFLANLLVLNSYVQGGHIFCIDASYSYYLQCKELHNGVYLNFDDKNRISFNPFYMEWLKENGAKRFFQKKGLQDVQINENGIETEETRYSGLLQEKINTIQGVLTSVTKGEDEKTSRIEESIYRKIIYEYFKHCCLNDKVEGMKFDDFFAFTSQTIHSILEEYKIDKEVFNPYTFLLMLEEFKTGNSLGYLLNSMDDKIRNLEKERFVVIDVSRIRNNKVLFSVVSVLSMDLYNQKVARLPKEVVKILNIDEAWQSISSPQMAFFMKEQVKVIRKYGGQTMFISQELDDFISSEIIKSSIINNSAIKIFADMGEFKNKFEPIKKELAISDTNEAKIKSLNQNNRNLSYKEICICWGQKGEVYAVETPYELKAIFETNPDELKKIIPSIEKYGIELASINYANAERGIV